MKYALFPACTWLIRTNFATPLILNNILFFSLCHQLLVECNTNQRDTWNRIKFLIWSKRWSKRGKLTHAVFDFLLSTSVFSICQSNCIFFFPPTKSKTNFCLNNIYFGLLKTIKKGQKYSFAGERAPSLTLLHSASEEKHRMMAASSTENGVTSTFNGAACSKPNVISFQWLS